MTTTEGTTHGRPAGLLLSPAGFDALSQPDARTPGIAACPCRYSAGGQSPARLGLVPASRPADVLPSIGWSGFAPGTDGTLSLAAVLRSWEDRFGARLLEVGFAEILLLVERPPRTGEAAQRLAAEQFVFCSECTLAGRAGLSDVSSITAGLVNTPIWGFWWD